MNKKILVVDDEEFIVIFLQYNLEWLGYDVIIVLDGEEVFKKVEIEKFDLIVFDVMFLKLDGIEVCKQLRQ